MSEYHPKLQVVRKDVDLEVQVASETAPGAFYTVKNQTRGDDSEWTCTCKAFEFGQGDYCKHISTVRQRLVM